MHFCNILPLAQFPKKLLQDFIFKRIEFFPNFLIAQCQRQEFVMCRLIHPMGCAQ